MPAKGNYKLQCWMLTKKLEGLTPGEIISFDRTFSVLMAKSYSYRLWEAAYALNVGCSDDGFEYFRSWLIGQGQNNFYWAVKYPRVLFLIGVKEIIENYEGIAYCAFEAYLNKSGDEIPTSTDITYESGGRIFNEKSALIKYPELALLAW